MVIITHYIQVQTGFIIIYRLAEDGEGKRLLDLTVTQEKRSDRFGRFLVSLTPTVISGIGWETAHCFLFSTSEIARTTVRGPYSLVSL